MEKWMSVSIARNTNRLLDVVSMVITPWVRFVETNQKFLIATEFSLHILCSNL